jgi:hypothetical protein
MSHASWYRLMLRPLPLTYLAFFSFLFLFLLLFLLLASGNSLRRHSTTVADAQLLELREKKISVTWEVACSIEGRYEPA